MFDNFWIYFVLAISSFINIIVPISGSSTVTPFLAILTDPHLAIGLASFYFLLSGIIRISMFRKGIRWEYVKSLLPISLIFAAGGAFALVEINPLILLIIILVFTLFFFYKKIRQIFNKKEEKPMNKFSVHLVGVLSGFLQGSGLAGSDLRNGYLYSKKLSIAEVHGTSSLIGTSNFLIATIIRLGTNQITIPNLIPLLYIFPFMIIGIWLGKIMLYKIDKKHTDWIIIFTMGLIIFFLALKIVRIL